MIEVESPFFLVGQTILHQIGQEFYWVYGITPYWGYITGELIETGHYDNEEQPNDQEEA